MLQLFDMNKYQQNLVRETRMAYPDRRRLEKQCLSAIVFVQTNQDLLQCPVWVLIVNVVGLDKLKSKFPYGKFNYSANFFIPHFSYSFLIVSSNSINFSSRIFISLCFIYFLFCLGFFAPSKLVFNFLNK